MGRVFLMRMWSILKSLMLCCKYQQKLCMFFLQRFTSTNGKTPSFSISIVHFILKFSIVHFILKCHRQCTLSASHFQKAGMNSSLLGLRTNSSSYDSMKIPVILPAIDLPFPVLCLCPNVTLKVL